ncbi:MAG: dihydrofolate reductase [Acidobacteria bacterium]|nr:dihydrofolate reductase [Acidobacteriota bacterium]
MRRIVVFNNVTLDGYYTGLDGDMSWAHKFDPEWQEFTNDNAKGNAVLAFGRKTYDMMAGYWPTPMAMKNMPIVAEAMNKQPKLVFSRTMNEATWSNTTLVKGDLVTQVRKIKSEPGDDIVIMGSGNLISQLAQAKLIDMYQIALAPVVLGKGKSMFDGVDKTNLKLTQSRAFGNGTVVLWYQAA